MMTRGLFGLLLWTFSGSVSAVMGKLKKDASPGRRTQSFSEAECNDWKSNLEDESTTCECQAGVDGTGTTSLNCMKECEYCNDDSTICGQESFDQLYDENGGDPIGLTESFVYTKGRNETVTLQADIIGDSCQVFLDGQECESCTLNVGTDGHDQGYHRGSFNCTNFEADAVYDLCDDPRIFSDGSVFEPWATEFGYTGLPYNGICHLPTDTEAPTEAPTEVSTDLPTEAQSSTPVGAVITVTSLIVLFATIVTMI